MVQVIDRAPSIGSVLGNILGQTVGGAAQGAGQALSSGLQNQVEDFYEQKKTARDRENVQKRLNQLYESEEGKNLTPLQKQLLSLSAEKVIPQNLASALWKQNEINTKEISTLSENFPKIGKELIGKTEWEALEPQTRKGFQDAVVQKFKETGDWEEAVNFGKEELLNYLQEPLADEIEDDPNLYENLLYGYKQSTLSSVLGHSPTEQEIQDYESRNPSFKSEVQQMLGALGGDLPFLAAGGAIGGPIGALTVNGLVKRGADEIRSGNPKTVIAALGGPIAAGVQYAYDKLSGNEKTLLQEDPEAASRIVTGALKDATMGYIFKKIPGLEKLAKKSPFFKRILENKVGKKVFEVGAATAAMGTGGPILEGRLPTSKDYLHGLANVFAFEILGLPGRVKQKILNSATKSKLPAEEFANRLKTEFENQGFTAKQLQAKDPQAMDALERTAFKIGEPTEKTIEERTEVPPETERLEERTQKEKAVAERISQEPVEKILEKRMTKAEKVANKKLEALENKKEKLENDLDLLENSRKKGSAYEGAKKLLRNQIEENNRDIENVRAEAEEARAIAKSKRAPPPTEAETQALIKKHITQLEEAAAHPRKASSKELNALFERDQKYIEEAERLADKDTLPSPKKFDTYLKILDAYNRSYKALLKNSKNQLKKLGKPTKENAKELKKLKNLTNLLERNIKINEAKQKLHSPKNYIREVARGKGRTFLKKYLKDLGIRAKEFKKNFFEAKKELSEKEAKTAEVGNKALSEAIKNVVKNPTEKNVEALTATGEMTKPEVNEAQQKAQKIVEKAEKAAEENKSPNEFINVVKDELAYFKNKNIPKIKKAIVGGLVLGGLQEGVESLTGIHLPISYMSIFFPGTRGIRFGASMMVSLMRQMYNKYENHQKNSQYKKARSERERINLIRKWKKEGLSQAEINKRIKGV